MIPVTNEPMEGVVFDVQDYSRRTGTTWTGTHGEMISSDCYPRFLGITRRSCLEAHMS
jgi:hypothetical protein